MIDIGIIMFNALGYSQRCLNSILATMRDVPYRLYVFDNGSTDGTAQWLSTLGLPNLDVRSSPVNLGVAKGRNALLSRMPPDELILLIDNDIEFRDGWHEPFLSLFRDDPKAGVVGIEGYNVRAHESGRDAFLVVESGTQPCDILRGCLMFLRGQVVRELGGFDEQCGMYWHDDDDFCIRALGRGYRHYRIQTNLVVHHGSQSSLTTFPDVRDPLDDARVSYYLSKKWHGLGLIGPDGRPIRIP